jgi:hypothetical protein
MKKETLNLKTKYNVEKDAISLEITISDNLKKILLGCVVANEFTSSQLENGFSFERHLIRKVVNLVISNNNYTYLLFSKDLLSTGILVVDVDNVVQLNTAIDRIRGNIDRVIRTYYEVIREREITLNIDISAGGENAETNQ